MNDLTFGATILSLFATLVVAVIVETTAAPTRSAEAQTVTRTSHSAVLLARASDEECTSVALAPSVAR